MAAIVREAIGPDRSDARSIELVYAPGSASSVARICHAVDASVLVSLAASAARAEEKKSASSLLRTLCFLANSSFVFTSARSKSRRIVASASLAEALHE